MRVYIAGPYSSDPVLGTRAAVRAADKVRDKGHCPFVPHLTLFWHLLMPRPYEDWLDYDLEWLRQCGAVIRLPGDSRGADKEVSEAERLGIPVYDSVYDFLKEEE